jgi:hypothetical protein
MMVMIAQEILTPLAEVNPSTLLGSDSPNLNLERFWAVAELSKIKNQFDTVYILGSWYGNVALMLFMLQRYIKFDQIINDEINGDSLRTGQQRLKQLGLADRTQPMLKDANKLDYQQLGPDGLVINLSCHNIKGLSWLDHIPKGTMIVLQARNQDPGAVNQYKNFAQFDQSLPLSQTLYQDTLSLIDPDSAYEQYMKIGVV